MTLFALAILATLDETLVRVFTSEADLRAFAAANPPDIGRTQTGPIAEAYDVRDLDQPSQYLCYLVTKLVDGVPVETKIIMDPEDDPFDPTQPIFYKGDVAA